MRRIGFTALIPPALLLISSLFFPNPVSAYIAVQPNCTAPPANVNYLGSPPLRGTLDIVWSCFSVLLTCTWASLHLAVPTVEDPLSPDITNRELNSEPPKRGPIRWLFRLLRRGFKRVARGRRKSTASRKQSQDSKSGGDSEIVNAETPVPPPQRSRFRETLHWFKEQSLFWCNKAKWMGITVLMPEYMLGKAAAEHSSARFWHQQFLTDFPDSDWTVTHCYFANMRGMVLRFETDAVRTPTQPSKPSRLGNDSMEPHKRDRSVPFTEHTPYVEQEPLRARRIELQHCVRLCGNGCTHRKGLYDLAREETRRQQSTAGSPITPRDERVYSIAARTLSMPTTITSPSTAAFTASPLTEKLTGTTFAASPATYTAAAANPSLLSLPRTHNDKLAPSTPTATEKPSPLRIPSTTLRSIPQIIATPSTTPGHHAPWSGTWALSASQWHWAYRHALVSFPTPISKSEIKDKAQNDELVKAFAVAQIIWLVIQIIARAAQSLAITLLEVTVVAFSACALLIYAANWHKPQDVDVPSVLRASPAFTPLPPAAVRALAARSPASSIMVHEFWLHGYAIRDMADSVFPTSPGMCVQIPGVMKQPAFIDPIMLGIGAGGIIFGSIHFAAWNFAFPSEVEKTLWRISCVVLLLLPVLSTTFYCVVQHFARKYGATDGVVTKVLRVGIYTQVPFYLVARFYLLVEVFRALAYPEPSVFSVVNWPNAMPHYS